MAQNYTPTNSPVNSFKAAVRMGWPGKAVAIDGPVHLVLTFMFPRSKSKTRKVNIQEPKTGKPDIDNLIKSVADALTGLAWKDDAQIASVVAMKRTAGDGDTAGVAIRIVVAD
jgi:Holliday junction resolvase RusA-like endonuclease